jgi:hypothetical protein
MYEIVIGRSKEDREKIGTLGTIFLGKQYVQMGQTVSLSTKVYLDMIRSHVVFICGKRGGGKSYTMGVIAEGMADMPEEIKQNLSIILLDTMGIYWTMKFANHKEEHILKEWNIPAKSLDVEIYTPAGFYKKFKEQGIQTDHPFSIRPNELDSGDWCMTFGIDANEPAGVLMERVIGSLRRSGANYSIIDMIKAIRADKRGEQKVKDMIENKLINSVAWGLFSQKGTPLKEIAAGGKVTVLDVSCYNMIPNGWNIKSLVVGLVSQKLFMERMNKRKIEEFREVHSATHYFDDTEARKQKFPLVWLVIDEAHEFLPNVGMTMASSPLITILREGRQPGISLILASQQPGKIHTDVMTQSDTIISHRITAKIDTDALGALMQSYMREGLDVVLDHLPRKKGAAVIFDDTNERLYQIQVRPRFTWHGGESPTAYHPPKNADSADLAKIEAKLAKKSEK